MVARCRSAETVKAAIAAPQARRLRYVFQVPFAGRSLEDLPQGINQRWRPNIKKADKADVKVVQGDYEDLPAFYDIHVETAERGRFIPRPPACFQRMRTALKGPWIPTACASASPSTRARCSRRPRC